MKTIRATKHTLKYANQSKLDTLSAFVDEYRRVAELYLDYLWNNPYTWDCGGQAHIMNISKNQYYVPSYFDYKIINPQTTLSARALSSLVTQLAGIISAATRRQSKRIWKLHQLLESGQQPSKSLINKIRQQKPQKPNLDNLRPELSTKCADLQETKGKFDAYIRLKSLGKSFGSIKLPIKYHKRSNHWKQNGKRLSSFLIDKHFLNIRYELKTKSKSKGTVVGADQGMLTTLTLSDNQTTPPKDNHGHTLKSITQKLSRKRKGSKSFLKAQHHRVNYINWSINQLNFKNIKQVNLEEIRNINYKKRTSRFMTHWNNTLIRDKLLRKCEEQEVLVKLQPSAYRSQRCSSCGLVCKANRKGKQYICKCGLNIDADLNASKNHEQNLYYLSWESRNYIKNNHLNAGSGFYWCGNGIFNSNGEEFRVPLSTNKDNNI